MMMKSEIRMTKSERIPKPEAQLREQGISRFELRHSDLIRHSSFVIRHF